MSIIPSLGESAGGGDLGIASSVAGGSEGPAKYTAEWFKLNYPDIKLGPERAGLDPTSSSHMDSIPMTQEEEAELIAQFEKTEAESIARRLAWEEEVAAAEAELAEEELAEAALMEEEIFDEGLLAVETAAGPLGWAFEIGTGIALGVAVVGMSIALAREAATLSRLQNLHAAAAPVPLPVPKMPHPTPSPSNPQKPPTIDYDAYPLSLQLSRKRVRRKFKHE